ncbi:hypothetical protein [Nostoc sp.]
MKVSFHTAPQWFGACYEKDKVQSRTSSRYANARKWRDRSLAP